MIATPLDCSALGSVLELSNAEAEPDLSAIDLHLSRCAKCRATYPEVAYLRGVRDPIEASSRFPRSHRPIRALAAAAVLMLCTFALERSTQRLGDPSAPSGPDRSSITRVGRVRILPSHTSSVTTTVASSTGTRNSTTRRTIAPEPRTN